MATASQKLGDKVARRATARPLYVIAADIADDYASKGKPVHPYAHPYVRAMFSLDRISDYYGQDTGVSVVSYALANLGTWRGETAKRIKAELKGLL